MIISRYSQATHGPSGVHVDKKDRALLKFLSRSCKMPALPSPLWSVVEMTLALMLAEVEGCEQCPWSFVVHAYVSLFTEYL